MSIREERQLRARAQEWREVKEEGPSGWHLLCQLAKN